MWHWELGHLVLLVPEELEASRASRQAWRPDLSSIHCRFVQRKSAACKCQLSFPVQRAVLRRTWFRACLAITCLLAATPIGRARRSNACCEAIWDLWKLASQLNSVDHPMAPTWFKEEACSRVLGSCEILGSFPRE